MPDDTPQPDADADAERLVNALMMKARDWCAHDAVFAEVRRLLHARDAVLRERDAEIERLRAALPVNGHLDPCVICGEPCNSLAGNPSLWPVRLGNDGWRHIGCVNRLLAERNASPPQSDIERAHAIIDKAYQEGKAKAESCGAEYGWSDDAIRMATESIRYEFLGNVVAAALSAACAEGERIGEARAYATRTEALEAVAEAARKYFRTYSRRDHDAIPQALARLDALPSDNELAALKTMADAAEQLYWALNRASLDTVGAKEKVFDALRLLGRYLPPRAEEGEPR